MLIYVPVAIGFNLVTGNLGQLAFSNLAFFSAGAYTSGVLSLHLGWPWWTTIVPAGLLAGGLGALVGSVALRGLRGFYLAIATLALGELMRWGYIHMGSLTGGAGGFAVPTPSVFGWELNSAARSDGRRVGKESVSTCRNGWWP